jgi:hypothetical protein
MNDLIPLVVVVAAMTIPIVAIIGGITAGIIKSNARHRLLELAQRERIAALERGVDPERLPKLELPKGLGDNGLTFEQKQLRRSQGLRLWGFICVGFGITMFLAIGLSEGYAESAPSLMFAGVGAALILGGTMVRPKSGDLPRDEPRG